MIKTENEGFAMKICGKTIAISLLLAVTPGSAVFADSLLGTIPDEPTLMVLPGSDEENAVSLETVSSISAIPTESTVEAGYPVLSVLFGRVPIPTPRPTEAERQTSAASVTRTRRATGLPSPRQNTAATSRPRNIALAMEKRRIPTPMPPIIGVYR